MEDRSRPTCRRVGYAAWSPPARLSWESIWGWSTWWCKSKPRERSIIQRLWNYLSSPWFIDTFKSFLWIFVTFIFIGFLYFFKKQAPKKQNLIYSLLFFLSAIMANAAFGGSYAFPVALRSLNGSIIVGYFGRSIL